MLVSTTVLLTILSAVSIGVLSGYVAICGIIRLFARRRRRHEDPTQTTQVIASAAHASGD